MFFVSTAAGQSRPCQCRSAWILCDGKQRVPGDVPGYGGDRACVADRDACGTKLLELARSGDRIVIMGARDDTLTQFARELLLKL